MEHIEFIDRDHFENEYHRRWATGALSRYIDFCWETNFDQLFSSHPSGFSDVLFPNIGYTYLINLGTPIVMQLQTASLQVKNDGFLPRHHYITCHHTAGNKLFGIKFKVCPIVFEKEVDFSEYNDFIYPLAYLIDSTIVRTIKGAKSFEERADIVFNHYDSLVNKHRGSLHYIDVVTEILDDSLSRNEFDERVGEMSRKYNTSSRTLQRYFRATTSFTSKDALQTMRIRHAVTDLTTSPSTFSFLKHGYYDYSHFLKHLNQFTGDKYYKVFLEVYKSGKTT